MTLAIDTLQASEALESAGFKKSQAKAMIEALTPSAESFVTKQVLDSAINKLRSELIVWMVGLHVATISLILTILS